MRGIRVVSGAVAKSEAPRLVPGPVVVLNRLLFQGVRAAKI